MKRWIKNEATLQNEQVTIKEDAWAYVVSLGLIGAIFVLFAGAFFLLRP